MHKNRVRLVRFLRKLSIVSGQAASRSNCYFQARLHLRLQDVYLPQKLDASHHLPHPYNAGARGLGFHLHRSTALGDRLPGHGLSLSLLPVLRSLLYVEVWLVCPPSP
jgi:hypothetical protein